MQLTKPSQVCKESVIFRKPKTDKHGNESIKIQTKYPEGRLGPLVIETPFLFSFGVSERKSIGSDELVGYTLPVCLWGKDEKPTPEQKEFEECLSNIKELCYEYLDETYGVDVSERLSESLYYKTSTDKKGRKKRDESFPPVLYAKLLYSGKDSKNPKILSLFRTKGDNNVDPMLYFEKYCTVKMALIIDSIYINDEHVSLQLRVSECYVKPHTLCSIKPLLEIEESDEELE